MTRTEKGIEEQAYDALIRQIKHELTIREVKLQVSSKLEIWERKTT